MKDTIEVLKYVGLRIILLTLLNFTSAIYFAGFADLTFEYTMAIIIVIGIINFGTYIAMGYALYSLKEE